MLRKKDTYNNSQQGFAAIMVLIMLLILVVLGTSLLSTWSMDAMKLKQEEDSMQAYYTAYSVANALLVDMENKSISPSTTQLFSNASNDNTLPDSSYPFGSDGRSQYKVKVARKEGTADYNWIIITVRGMAGNSHRDITLKVKESIIEQPTPDGDNVATTYSYRKEEWKNL